jgi:hypothetical protein
MRAGTVGVIALLLIGALLLPIEMVSLWKIHMAYVGALLGGWLLLLVVLRRSCRARESLAMSVCTDG